MRLVFHAGTRACDAALDEALSGWTGPVAVLVPAEPRLLGALADAQGLAGDLAELARLVGEAASRRAVRTLERERASVGTVFGGQGVRATPSVTAHVVQAPLERHLPALLERLEADTLHAARDTLRLFDHAEVDVAGAVETVGARLVAF